ncbi:MAG: acyl-CoA dehydrogenase family protein [Planctomycetota bacterium]|nr:acyl-CoA dehydrogenase family protein [Planctomycetota bacterium]
MSKPSSDDRRAEAMEVAEAAREETRTKPSFAAEVFLGHLPTSLFHPFPEQPAEDRAQGDAILDDIDRVLREEIDPDAVDATGELPDRAIERLKEAGAFRLKLPAKYGGLGLSQSNYNRIVALVGSWCGSTAIWMSGHQSIGVPTPLKLFGTDEQKERYLPRLAAGELSAFALTEPEVGSDPARMETVAERAPDGDGWILNGEKLWCTNGPKADIMIVMARTPDREIKGRKRKQISAFIVEAGWPGVSTTYRCDFLGYGGIQSGQLKFENVRVPAENLLWNEGQGLKLALITLNTGRLTLPATNTAVAKQCLSIVRRWASKREQWGAPIGRHEAVSVQIGWIASHAFAMDALTDYVAALADRGDSDIRLEAAMAKLWCSEAVFEIADRTMQIRGGRGYETPQSLKGRGESAYPVERIFRESRLNRIVEGTSEIMRLFLAREALDPHLARAGALADPKASSLAKAWAVIKAAPYYTVWYLRRVIPFFGMPANMPPPLRRHWRYLRRSVRRLARRMFYAMVRHGPALEHRQGVLGRLVDECADLVAMGLTISRAISKGDAASVELADLFCRHARARINMRHTVPDSLSRVGSDVARGVLEGRYLDLERGILPVEADGSPGERS